MWPTWAKVNEKGLAQYARKEVGDHLRLDLNRDDTFTRPNGRRLVADAIYRALANHKIRYSAPPYNPDLAVQEIRDPDILDRSGNGTCLDLALLFASAALGNNLLPLLVLLKGHALVAVSTTRGRPDHNAPIRKTDEGDWVAQGILRDAETLKSLVDHGEYFLIECTGFAATGVLLPTVPEGVGRVDGLLSFDRAVAAGREQLERRDRAFLFAVDIAFLQDFGRLAPHEPPGWSLHALPDLRRRLTRILEDHRIFGGRQDELDRINDFVAKASSGFLLVTGPSGCGKTALLANWIRQRTGRGEAVAYHFINRQHQLAAHDDTLRTLLQQLRYQEGLRGSAGGTGAELEAAYLERLEETQVPLVVVLDGLDEADGWTPGPQLFPRALPSGLRVIVSAREIAGRDWVKELNLPLPTVIKLGPLTEAGILDVLQSAAVPEWVKAPEALAMLTAKSEGDPFYLSQLILDLFPAGRNPANIRSLADLSQQPGGLDGYLEQWWSDIQEVVKGERSVKQILGYLLVARGPLTREDLLGLGPDDVVDWSTVDPALKLVERLWLHPETIFGLAQTGAAEDAEQQLSLFQGEEYWREAGLLLIAWLLASTKPDDARGVVRRFPADWTGLPTLRLLRDRVLATLGDASVPELTLPYYPVNLPTAPSEDEIQQILAHAGGNLDFLRGTSGLLISATMSGLEASEYVTERVSPYMVAFAISQSNFDYLRQYIAIYAGNPYADYRNKSLWGLLGAVLCIPDDLMAKELSVLLASGGGRMHRAQSDSESHCRLRSKQNEH